MLSTQMLPGNAGFAIGQNGTPHLAREQWASRIRLPEVEGVGLQEILVQAGAETAEMMRGLPDF